MAATSLRDRPIALAKRVGGRPCLDFANTVKSWVPGPGGPESRDERLHDHADLLAWALESRLLDPAAVARLHREAARRPRAASAVAGRARRLRDAIYRVAWRVSHGNAPAAADVQAIEGEAAIARGRQRLLPAERGLAWRLPAEDAALDVPLWPVALDAAEYFTTGDLTRLHACPGEDCGWLFEDKTRNRSRQWCDMADCGTIVKVRRFRSRQAAEARGAGRKR